MVLSISHLSPKNTKKANNVRPSESHRRVVQSGINTRMGPKEVSVTVIKRVFKENQIPRFNITPTTAEVIPDKAEERFLFPLKCSM